MNPIIKMKSKTINKVYALFCLLPNETDVPMLIKIYKSKKLAEQEVYNQQEAGCFSNDWWVETVEYNEWESSDECSTTH